MNKYTAMRDRHGRLINGFPMAFAFSNKQFEEAKKKLGVESPEELLSIPGSGMIRKTDQGAYTDMLVQISNESAEAELDDEYMYQGFLYELANHEYGYTYDTTDTLAVFGLEPEYLEEDERLRKIMDRAITTYLGGFEG